MAAAQSKPLPLSDPMLHEDASNRRRMVKMVGTHDGINVLPQLADDDSRPAIKRRLFWRLQGQAAVLDGDEKLVRPSHRKAELFRPATDKGESIDLIDGESERAKQLFELLGRWESSLPTVPLWGSSPYWSGDTAKHYDAWPPREEPFR
jgi:arylsulfatase B